MYGWEYKEEQWLDEKRYFENKWIEANISRIKEEIEPKVVEKLIRIMRFDQKEAQSVAKNLISDFETYF